MNDLCGCTVVYLTDLLKSDTLFQFLFAFEIHITCIFCLSFIGKLVWLPQDMKAQAVLSIILILVPSLSGFHGESLYNTPRCWLFVSGTRNVSTQCKVVVSSVARAWWTFLKDHLMRNRKTDWRSCMKIKNDIFSCLL